MNTTIEPTTRYIAPDWASRRIGNPVMTGLVKLGIGMRGARELHVRGRTSGEWRTVPVNPLEIDGRTYLVAPRGHTQWVRNLRAAGEGRLRIGRRYEDFTAAELVDLDKAPVIREYLHRWAFEVGKYFEGLSADSSDGEIAAIAADFPVFEITIG